MIRYLVLNKIPTYTSGFLNMCAWQESDLRPSGPQPDALSTELQAHLFGMNVFLKSSGLKVIISKLFQGCQLKSNPVLLPE
jgi:hypothetical protein